MANKAKPTSKAKATSRAKPKGVAGDRIEPPVQHHAPMEARVLGGPDGPAAPETAWDREPLLTLKDEPRLFQIGLPVALLAGLFLGLALLGFGLPVALLVMLAVQTGGFFATYVVAQRRRTDPLRHRPADRGSAGND